MKFHLAQQAKGEFILSRPMRRVASHWRVPYQIIAMMILAGTLHALQIRESGCRLRLDLSRLACIPATA